MDDLSDNGPIRESIKVKSQPSCVHSWLCDLQLLSIVPTTQCQSNRSRSTVSLYYDPRRGMYFSAGEGQGAKARPSRVSEFVV